MQTFDLRKCAEDAKTIAVIGRAGSGKTTLVRELIRKLQSISVNHSFSLYGKTFPFLTLICSLKDTWKDDYITYKKELGLKHSVVSFTKGRYYYTQKMSQQSLIVLEDIPARLRSSRHKRAFEIMLKSLLSRRRRSSSKSVFIFVSQYLSLLPNDIIPEISYFVFMERGFNMSALRECFDNRVCKKVRRQCNELGKYEYFVFDVERMIISFPLDTKNPALLVNALLGNPFKTSQVVEHKNNLGVSAKTKTSQIKYELRQNPFISVYSLAKKLNTYPQFIINIRAQMRKMGLIPKEITQEFLDKRVEENRAKLLKSLEQLGVVKT